MEIVSLSSFLIYPGKNLEDAPEALGTLLALEGNLYGMLSDVFERSDRECDIPIRFTIDENGSQTNPVRNMLLDFIGDPGLPKGRALANRLRDFTTKVPGLGLLFLILGRDEHRGEWKIALSRFPADRGILAEADEEGLRVEFIERIFMKSRTAYKAAVYRHGSLVAGFWSGHAVDKQLNAPNYQVAHYWIHEFLASDFKTTPKAGTKRFAVAMREATRDAPIEVQRELIGLRLLAGGLSGQSVSIQGVMEDYGLSQEARRAITAQLAHEGLITDQFVLDYEELERHAPFTSVELNTGGVLLAPSDKFNEVFRREAIDEASNRYQFVAEGEVVDERVRGRK